MATRTITIEDDEYEELEDERNGLLDRIEILEQRGDELLADLGDLQEMWNDKGELLKRIGELS